MNDWHYITFYAGCHFFVFQFQHVFRKFSAVYILFVVKISPVVSETIHMKFLQYRNISYLVYYVQCLPLNIFIKWTYGSVSTVASMVIRSWLNNSPIVGAMTEHIFNSNYSSTLSYFYYRFLTFYGVREVVVN